MKKAAIHNERPVHKQHRTGGRQKRKSANAVRRNRTEEVISVDMYVARVPESRDNHFGSAKPCSECDRWIRICAILGIKITVYYSMECGHVERYDGNPSTYKLNAFLW